MAHPFGKLVGGRLCLDFVNSVKGRIPSGAPKRGRDYADRVVGERLVSYGALADWGVLAGALSAREASALIRRAAVRPAEAASVLDRALTVREAIYRLFKCELEDWPPRPEDVDALNRELRIARSHEHLVASPDLVWHWDDAAALDRVLWPVVRSAADLLTSTDLQRVGQCPGEECGWLFLDTSRSGRRQWCDMADCGNLAKVRRFRQKRLPGRAGRRSHRLAG